MSKRPDSAWSRVQHIPGLTYRRLDHWCFKGYVHVRDEDGEPCHGLRSIGQGSRRTIADDEIRVLTVMCELVTLGFEPAAASFVARALDSGVTKFGSLHIERAS
jgi:hypothetical protein